MISRAGKVAKRSFDIFFSVIGILLFSPIIFIAWLIASIETKSNGLFCQKRVGMNGVLFRLYKIKTMKIIPSMDSKITALNDPRITWFGAYLRRFKIDELPQLFNVLIGQMSFVGPRPDVEGYADNLKGEEVVILSVRPGITGPASLKYRNEELILKNQINPAKYNDDVIWPDKVKINISYINDWSFRKDMIYILRTFVDVK